MSLSKFALFASLALALVAPTLDAAPAYAEATPPDNRAEKVLNGFMDALHANSDVDAAAKAALPFIHKSLYSADGTTLSPTYLNYSFKKAWASAKHYSAPVKVTRIVPAGTATLGAKSTAELGSLKTYVVAHEHGTGNIRVFFPSSGGDPKIASFEGL